MRVHHLNCGTMRPPGGRLIDDERGLFRRAEMVCHCLLVETDAGLVLIETGLGTPGVTRPREWLGGAFLHLVNPVIDEAETAVARVRGLGFDPGDVRHIVLTHLDLDHAGGLVDFPRATVHLYERELHALRSPVGARERLLYRRAQFAHGPVWSAYADTGEPWFGFDAVRELRGLPPEILLVPLGGHTRGHAGVAIDTGKGWLLHAGDAYFHPGQLHPANPHCPPGLALFESLVQTVPSARRHNQQRLRDLVRDHGSQVTVFCAHSPTELRQAQQPAPQTP
jgi:glyoxylase-like metal-dependent hydrolase (beta-lactamase superfamily II)